VKYAGSSNQRKARGNRQPQGGCARNLQPDTELKEEIKKSKNLLWIILLVLAATQGPQVGDLLATVKAQQAAIEALQAEVAALKARVSKLEVIK